MTMHTPPWILPLDKFRRVATDPRRTPIVLPVSLLRDPAVITERYGVGIRRHPAAWKYEGRWLRFLDDIRRHGIRSPVAIDVEEDGIHLRVIDGTHRLLAADELGISCVRVEVVPDAVDRAWAWLIQYAIRCGYPIPARVSSHRRASHCHNRACG